MVRLTIVALALALVLGAPKPTPTLTMSPNPVALYAASYPSGCGYAPSVGLGTYAVSFQSDTSVSGGYFQTDQNGCIEGAQLGYVPIATGTVVVTSWLCTDKTPP